MFLAVPGGWQWLINDSLRHLTLVSSAARQRVKVQSFLLLHVVPLNTEIKILLLSLGGLSLGPYWFLNACLLDV